MKGDLNFPLTHCKFCGARLKKDHIGKYCPSKNCQWSHGLTGPEADRERLTKGK